LQKQRALEKENKEEKKETMEEGGDEDAAQDV